MEDRIFVEDFQDVIEISKECISLLFKQYELILKGEELQVVAFSKSEMILYGKILSVNFEYRNV